MTQNSKSKVLLVEDEHELRELVANLFEQAGLDPVTASNGSEAMEKVRSQSFDTILSDLKMPGMDGLSFLLELRSAGYETPFIVLTGYADKASAITALRLGATDFLEKPFDPKDLLVRVRQAVEFGARIRQINQELDQLCSQQLLSPEQLRKYREAKKAILLMKKQRDL